MQTAPAIKAPNHTPPAADHGAPLDYRNPEADGRIPVEAESRTAVVDEAQATVVELLDLYHAAKQSHWNIRGPLFAPLHEKLQGYAATYLEYADLLAERILHVGFPADGRPGTVVNTADLGEFPAGFLADKHVLELMANRVTMVSQRVRQRILHLRQVDEVTSNKLQDLGYELDKQVWQLRAHMQ
ncbi:DNA starvation/stationary phase protection protein [Hymenobacter sp.]|uniref:Dps family protein n=1 Tax=Hymenobacter sp. TaxID=1898978 RepID=UPI00286CC0F4|nr:DNA starvation/stationary phase protection protein [Hymenobacter sp.]